MQALSQLSYTPSSERQPNHFPICRRGNKPEIQQNLAWSGEPYWRFVFAARLLSPARREL